MNKQLHATESDDLESRLDSAVQAVLAEPLPEDAFERVKMRATRLNPQTSSPNKRVGRRRAWPVLVARYGGIAAAAVVLAGIVSFSLFMDRTAGRAFADVIQNVKRTGSVQLTIITRLGRQPETEGKMYLEGNRMRMELAPRMLIQVADLSQGKALFLDTHRKLAQSIEVDEQVLKAFANPIDQLRRAKPEDAENLGEEYLKGRLAQVYRIRKIDLLGMSGNGEMLVWVDAKDGLPVKIVIHDPDPKAVTEVRFENFIWNDSLDPGLFAMSIPDGYQTGSIILTPRPANSTTPSVPSRIPESQRAQGILSRDRVPARIVWGPQGTTITALMREPESVPVVERRSNELRQWDVATGNLQWHETVGGAASLARTADGKTLATAIGYELQLRDSATGKVTQKWATDALLPPLAFSPDGKTLAAGIAVWGQRGAKESGGVQIWDVERASLVRSFADDKPTTFVRYSVDGTYVASASNGGPVKLWNTATGELARIFPGWRPDFSPDGRTIACASAEKAGDKQSISIVELYDIETGSRVKSLTNEKPSAVSWLLSVDFSPDGRLLATADWDGSVTIWDVATGELKRTITDHKGGVLSCVFAPDGNTLATGSEDKTLRLWEIQQLVTP